MSEIESADIVVIGGGVAGISAALRAVELGAKTCLVERAELGGQCLHRGLYSIKTALMQLDALRESGAGAELPGVADFFQTVKSAAKNISAQWEQNLEKRKIRFLRGTGSLVGGGKILVQGAEGERLVKSSKTILALGSVPKEDPLIPFNGECVFSSEEIFDFQTLPENILIQGANRCGIELAALLNQLGSRVFLNDEGSRLLSGFDPDLGLFLEEQMKKQKIKLLLNKKISSVYKNAGALLDVNLETGIKFSTDAMILCRANMPNSATLQGTGVDLGERKEVWVNEHMQTTLKGVYAVGSLTGRERDPLLSEEEGRVAAENALGKKVPLDSKQTPYLLHSKPPIASVGVVFAEAHHHGFQAAEGKCDLSKLDYSLARGDTAGWVKIVGDKSSKKVVGVHLCGPGAHEALHLAALAVKKGFSVKDFAELTCNWPSPFLGLKKAARACWSKLNKAS